MSSFQRPVGALPALPVFFALLILLPASAFAQQSPPPQPSLQAPRAFDPGAPVPATAYTSAFRDYRAGADSADIADVAEAPDKVWRAANSTARALGGHAGHMSPPNSSAAAKPDAHAGHASPAGPGSPAGHAGHEQKGK